MRVCTIRGALFFRSFDQLHASVYPKKPSSRYYDKGWYAPSRRPRCHHREDECLRCFEVSNTAVAQRCEAPRTGRVSHTVRKYTIKGNFLEGDEHRTYLVHRDRRNDATESSGNMESNHGSRTFCSPATHNTYPSGPSNRSMGPIRPH